MTVELTGIRGNFGESYGYPVGGWTARVESPPRVRIMPGPWAGRAGWAPCWPLSGWLSLVPLSMLGAHAFRPVRACC